MELIPEGKAGVLNALLGLGGALGCFFGTFVAESFGFSALFVMAGVVFFLGYIAFKTYTHLPCESMRRSSRPPSVHDTNRIQNMNQI
jgi:hypothetical protein